MTLPLLVSRRNGGVSWLVALAAVACCCSSSLVDAFVLRPTSSVGLLTSSTTPRGRPTPSAAAPVISAATTVLYAKKKKSSPALEALEGLDAALLEDDAPLSKKEQKELLKRQAKAQKKGAGEEENDSSSTDATAETPAASKTLSKKEQMLAKALALDALDQQSAVDTEDAAPKLSKKELKELLKKEKKQQEKEEKKRKKKEERAALDDEMGVDTAEAAPVAQVVTAAAEEEEDTSDKPTLEDKVRKDRPPPRIRVMESAQPGYTSLRLEGVGVTFRNQEVLKAVTWGVQTGDRIGLVGANGSGKTTQLRILAGELEPTTGDVVKSKKDLRVAMLRQEFVDELVPTRTLREEMTSVFAVENKILKDLKQVEEELAAGGDNPDRMQEILDRMQELQNEAEDKEVYVLESRVKKVLDLMGFTDDEGDDLVASFSGGWKMRIGLGKVLLCDPNILLLDEP
jgi:ABC-type dipeptide/oligopeptide/nickel transport system ATPase subunit